MNRHCEVNVLVFNINASGTYTDTALYGVKLSPLESLSLC
jgi:hypothetical protein